MPVNQCPCGAKGLSLLQEADHVIRTWWHGGGKDMQWLIRLNQSSRCGRVRLQSF